MGGLKLRIDKEYIVCALDQKPQKIDFTSVLCVFKTAHIIIWLCYAVGVINIWTIIIGKKLSGLLIVVCFFFKWQGLMLVL